MIEPTPTHPPEVEPDPTENLPDNDNTESNKDNSEALSQEDDSSDDYDIDTDMERVFTMINSGFNEDTNLFDPKAKEEKYFANCRNAFNDNEIVGCITAKPTYDDGDYVWVDFNDPKFDDIQAGWPDGGPMPHKKIELEHAYFCDSDFIGNCLGFNADTGLVYPVVAREISRRATSNTPINRGTASLQVVVKRVSLLLDKPHDFIPLILHTFRRMEIHSCLQLYEAMRNIQDNRELASAFKT